MTSWADAFGRALKVFIYTIGWVIGGGIIMAVGYYLGMPTDSSSAFNYFIIFEAFFIGVIIILFGGIASLLKIIGDMIEETQSSQIND
jgi:uncharacterized YccA/Bax inhibitor family protein